MGDSLTKPLESDVDALNLSQSAKEETLKLLGEWNESLPLHYALEKGASKEVMEMLLSAYPDGVKEKDSDGNLPLHYALEKSASKEVIEMLLSAYPDSVKEKGRNCDLPLHIALKKGASKEVCALVASAEEPAFNTVITFGTFDVLHHGHIRILQRAAAFGRRLVVGLSTDELNMSKKGRTPVYPFEQRKAILEAIRCVDHVFPEESLEKKEEYCRQHGADLLVMGDDWAGKFDAVGVEVRYLERTPAISTTQTIETCKSI